MFLAHSTQYPTQKMLIPVCLPSTFIHSPVRPLLLIVSLPSPPPPCQAALPFVRHLLELLSSCEVLGLRQLALGGITFQVLGFRGRGVGFSRGVQGVGAEAAGPVGHHLRGTRVYRGGGRHGMGLGSRV